MRVGSRTLGGSLVAMVLLREVRRADSWAEEEEEVEEEVSTRRVSRHTCRNRERAVSHRRLQQFHTFESISDVCVTCKVTSCRYGLMKCGSVSVIRVRAVTALSR